MEATEFSIMDGNDGGRSVQATLHIEPGFGLRASSEALALVPKKQAYQAQLLPLRLEGKTLVCAGYDPLDVNKVMRFSYDIRREVRIVREQKESVLEGLREAYGMQPFAESNELVDAVSSRPAQRSVFSEGPTEERRTDRLKTIAVTSGKGGVGKSSVTANLGLALRRLGYRVGMIDCDFGLSNLHVVLGESPKHTLADVIAHRTSHMEAMTETHSGALVLAGASGVSDIANMTYAEFERAGMSFDAFAEHFDFLLLDTGAGIHEGVISLLEAVDESIVVMSPDPTSVLDAYVTTRVLLERRPDARMRVVVNEVDDATAPKLIFAKFHTYLSLYMDGRADYLGAISSDEAVVRATRSRVPYVVAEPKSKASVDVDALARKLACLPQVRPERASFVQRLKRSWIERSAAKRLQKSF